MSESKDSMIMKKIHRRKHKFVVNSFQTKYYLKLNTDQKGLKCNVSDSIKNLPKM